MATVTAFIRTSTKKFEKVNVRFRLRDGREVQLFYRSDIEVNPLHWDAKRQELKAKIVFDDKARNDFNRSINEMKSVILEVYANIKNRNDLSSSLLDLEIDKFKNPDKYGLKKPETFIDIFYKFIDARKISETRKRNFKVIVRALQRFELFKRLKNKDFTLTFDGLTVEVLRNFEKFLTKEHEYYEKYPQLYKDIPEKRAPKPRGQNTLNDIFTKLRTFVLWANEEGLTVQNAFHKFKVKNCVYGTPYYITIDERNQIYHADLSDWPELAIQRDVFIFQCMIGCRVGDFLKMTKRNIVKGAIEYVQRKTKDGRPITVRVPLNETAKEIQKRYKDFEGKSLLPFTYEQKYNENIKQIFAHAEITRIVTVINPTTREVEQRPINEIASSHLARRTFIGNLYKQVKDPNLVGALSGHKEGSKAFARYRDIDEDMKADLVKMLE